ncbi:GIY-YIG nuclease family protein [Endozoicomonas sp. YOMI1]|uniref:GIY-YIG nuclease family protein n=1 Tax=Endozoicomonas sp. YOMI1 TaxID=2828739 RepID=UPI00214837E3|nr:GIY-YIG nuclease family protein [Endozoicomonas sp. YOMI1]
MQPATIKLFLVKGSPTGLSTAEISNWTGKAIAGPRSDLDDFLTRPELSSPGVYLLTGTDSESGDPVFYIGEAEDVSKRLKQHAKNEEKDYWIHTSAFVSKDDNLTKAHIRYIEGKLIQLAQTNKRTIIMNNAASGSSLPEADRAEMDVYIERMLQLLPVLGIHHLVYSLPATKSGSTITAFASESAPLFHCKVKGSLMATGKRSEGGFTVFKGSQAVENPVNSCPERLRASRTRLIEKGILAESDNCYVFTEDYEFSSPSAAACTLRGRSTNGPTSWVNDHQQSLRDLGL